MESPGVCSHPHPTPVSPGRTARGKPQGNDKTKCSTPRTNKRNQQVTGLNSSTESQPRLYTRNEHVETGLHDAVPITAVPPIKLNT